MSRFLVPLVFLVVFLALSCGREREKAVVTAEDTPLLSPNVPVFSADSAFYFVKNQVDFGPRVPNTPAHRRAGDYFVSTLKRYGAVVISQEFEATTFDNHRLVLRNIVASFYPEKSKRILLAAHWDTRPFADKDKQNPDARFDGANDGASGVGVLLEIARVLSAADAPPGVGVDIILFDGEDWGEKESARVRPPDNFESWWCLGSQYWSRNKHKSNYAAYYGILLDMVGGKNAQFYREGLSLNFAPGIVDKVWSIAGQLGYSHIFVKRNQGEILDDHKFVTEIAKIPMIDIVNYDPATGSFGAFHHTQADNLDNISKETLGAVGTTLLHVLYSEAAGV